MTSQLAQEIKELLNKAFPEEVVSKFKQKLIDGNLTRSEDPQNHFCVYFAAYDCQNQQVFIGNHKKSGLWLFNGGHIDKGESLSETVKREMEEEWGLDITNLNISAPSLITTAEINNPTKQTCRLHLDIWHFVNVDKDNFYPDQLKLSEEFHFVEWMDLTKARQIVTDKGTLQALEFIELNYFER